MEFLWSTSVLAAAVRSATPLALAAAGCILCYKAGITNLAIEGFMLMGSFLSIAFVSFSGGNVWLGIGGAIVGTMIYSLLFGLMSIKFKANQIITSIAMNMLSLGVTAFLLRTLFNAQGLYRPSTLNKIPNVDFAFLRKIPLINFLINGQSVIVYFAILIAVLVWFLLRKTPLGLNIISLGESEDAARTTGVPIQRTQWTVILLSAVFCAVAGAYLSTTVLSEFTENMIQGRGFTAYTIVVFANANPIAALLISLLFGYADALTVQLQLLGVGLPHAVVKMFPYLLALVVLAISSKTTEMRKAKSALRQN